MKRWLADTAMFAAGLAVSLFIALVAVEITKQLGFADWAMYVGACVLFECGGIYRRIEASVSAARQAA